MFFLTVAAVVLLQGVGLSFQVYSIAQHRWKSAVERWNRVQEIRSGLTEPGRDWHILPQARPLTRITVEDALTDDQASWEVLRAQK